MHEMLLGPRDERTRPSVAPCRAGEIPTADIQGLLDPWAEELGVTLRGDEIEQLLAPGGYTVVAEMIDRVRSLRADGYLTGLLTNTFAEFRPTMERDIDFALFDVIVESFAVGARKPEFAIYEIDRRAARSRPRRHRVPRRLRPESRATGCARMDDDPGGRRRRAHSVSWTVCSAREPPVPAGTHHVVNNGRHDRDRLVRNRCGGPLPRAHLPGPPRRRHPSGARRAAARVAPLLRQRGRPDRAVHLARVASPGSRPAVVAGVAVRLPRGAHPRARRLHRLRHRRDVVPRGPPGRRIDQVVSPTPASTAAVS